MSTIVAAAAANAENATFGGDVERLAYFLPEDLILPELTNLRLGTGTKRETESLQELADSIVAHGQVQPIVVREGADGAAYEVIAGRRRTQAIAIINANMTEGMAPLTIKAIIAPRMDDDAALQNAAMENIQRDNFTGIEYANLIGKVRARYNWSGAKNTKHVADWFKVSEAQIREIEKILSLPKDVQETIQTEGLATSTAQELAKVELHAPGKTKEVLANAKASQADEVARKGKGKSNGKGSGVQARHVAAAAREVVPDDVKKPLTKGELLDAFMTFEDSVPENYPLVQDFLHYLLGPFAKGQGSTKSFNAKFKALIAPACVGEKIQPPAPVEPPMPKAVASGKAKKAAKK